MTVERYLRAIADCDWDALRSLVAPDVVRLGPYGDDVAGRGAYVGYLSRLMRQLQGYAMDLSRVTYVDGGLWAFAELRETVTVKSEPTVTDEVLALELDSNGLIRRVEMCLRQGAAGRPGS